MKKGAVIWSVLIVCGFMIVGALALLTRALLEMERERVGDEVRAVIDEKAREALVQMDGVATTFLIGENQLSRAEFANSIQEAGTHEWVRARFEFGGGVPLSCPSSAEDSAHLIKLLSAEYAGLSGRELLCAVPPSADLQLLVGQAKTDWEANREPRGKSNYQTTFNNIVQTKRAATVEESLRKVVPQDVKGGGDGEPSRGLFEAKWLGEELFLIRAVGADGKRFQGTWLRAEAISVRLLDEISSLLPNARLMKREVKSQGERGLVSFPWFLEVGESFFVADMGWTPLRISLLVGWLAVVVALLAASALLRGVMALSERRADFVSSVTHELRTPLTTFRLYSGMLADGMVSDEGAKAEYLRTMQGEAERLHHLVENVLAYSKVERGGQAIRKERASLREIIARCEDRLRERVEREGAKWSTRLEQADFEVETDLTGVEQILFNLVDNACKYGLPSEGGGEVRLEVCVKGGKAEFRVCDRGVGVKFSERRRLFRPFHKSAEAAAGTKPGVGLGLSLCRKLARALGGDLLLEHCKEGACFCLKLS